MRNASMYGRMALLIGLVSSVCLLQKIRRREIVDTAGIAQSDAAQRRLSRRVVRRRAGSDEPGRNGLRRERQDLRRRNDGLSRRSAAGKPARSRIRLLEDTNGDGKIGPQPYLRRKRSGGQRIHAVEGRADRHQRARHPVPERRERRRKGGRPQGALHRLSESEPGGPHHESPARRGQLDLLLQYRFRRPHHFAGSSRNGRPFWCAARISGSIRSAARPKRLPDRRSSAPPSTISAIASSRKTRPTSGTSSCR